jgi:hypothetical protein
LIQASVLPISSASTAAPPAKITEFNNRPNVSADE